MSFTPTQVKAPSSNLNAKHIKTRCVNDGTALSYIEGWHVIAEANRIFGFQVKQLAGAGQVGGVLWIGVEY